MQLVGNLCVKEGKCVSETHLQQLCQPLDEGAALAQVNMLWVLVCCPRVPIPAPATPVHFQLNALVLNTQHIPQFGFLHQICKADPFLCSVFTLRIAGDDSIALQWWG